MKNKSKDTIFALSTPYGQSAIAVTRVSGDGALKIAKKITGKKKINPRNAYLCEIKDFEGKIMDFGLIIFFKSPQSYTGEDLLEIQTHGSIAIINKLLEELSKFNETRFADPGEFSMRAYKNGKADIIHYEGLARLISAETNSQRLIANKQTFGNSQNICERWRKILIKNIALIDSEIDFSEDQIEGNFEIISDSLNDLLFQTKCELDKSKDANQIIVGERILIFGPPNAGKSSLFNLLCQEDKMITSKIKGTTTDQGMQNIELFGGKMTIIDSAGLTRSSRTIEKKGIKKTIDSIKHSDNLILVLSPDSYSKENSELLSKTMRKINKKKNCRYF